MRFTIAILSCALVLSACGDDKHAAAKAKIKDLLPTYQQLNAEYETKFEGWQETLNSVIPARSAWLRSKGTDEESAAKAAFDAVNADSAEAIKLRDELRIKIRDVKDKLTKLGWEPKSSKGK